MTAHLRRHVYPDVTDLVGLQRAVRRPVIPCPRGPRRPLLLDAHEPTPAGAGTTASALHLGPLRASRAHAHRDDAVLTVLSGRLVVVWWDPAGLAHRVPLAGAARLLVPAGVPHAAHTTDRAAELLELRARPPEDDEDLPRLDADVRALLARAVQPGPPR
ncbi:MAG TPA: hypothetical protein VGD67_03400 [Pseudonocardiaceae bacterium]